MRLLWLPEVLRAAGLIVREVDGWRERGSSSWGPIRGVICHATAGGTGARAEDEVRVLLNGSTTAPPPIAQTYLARDGVWWVVASGRCNHALVGWAGPCKGLGNSNLVGVEAGNNNRGEPWPQAQLDSYQRGVAAISGRLQVPARMVAAHREHQPWPAPKGQTSTKSDPHGVDMTQFRARVSGLLTQEAPHMITPEDRTAIVRELLDTRIPSNTAGWPDPPPRVQDLLKQPLIGRWQADEIRELVQSAQRGEVDAAAVVDEIGRRLGPATGSGE